MKYEYLLIPFKTIKSPGELDTVLREYGAAGYRLLDTQLQSCHILERAVPERDESAKVAKSATVGKVAKSAKDATKAKPNLSSAGGQEAQEAQEVSDGSV